MVWGSRGCPTHYINSILAASTLNNKILGGCKVPPSLKLGFVKKLGEPVIHLYVAFYPLITNRTTIVQTDWTLTRFRAFKWRSTSPRWKLVPARVRENGVSGGTARTPDTLAAYSVCTAYRSKILKDLLRIYDCLPRIVHTRRSLT